MIAPLPDSAIKVGADRNGFVQLVLPVEKAGITHYGMAAFFIFWLGGWAFGWVVVMHQLLFGKPGGPTLFMIFWLGGWTVGGAWVIAMVWRMLRRPVPETFTFSLPDLEYDSGIPRLNVSFARQMDAWKQVFTRRKKCRFTKSEVATLRLRDVESGNRLTIDQGATRLELGRSLSEIEKEWLFQLLKSQYGA